MAEGEGKSIHPGSWVGDTVEEFKKLPVWGKILIAVIVAAVIFLAIRARQKAASQSTSATVGTAGDGSMGIGGSTADMSGASSSTPTPQPGSGQPTASGGNPPVAGPITPPTHTGGSPPPPTPHPGTPKLKTYTVVHGDTLSGIAARLHYQGGWQALYEKNRGVIGSNPNLIYAGTKLTL